MMCLLRGFGDARRAATAIEYSLIAGLIALAILASITTLGSNLNARFVNVSTDIPS